MDKFELSPRLHMWLTNLPTRSTKRMKPLVPPGIDPNTVKPTHNDHPHGHPKGVEDFASEL